MGWSLTFVTETDVDEFFDIETLMGHTVDRFDDTGLELGEAPVEIDSKRVPAKNLPGKKAKKRRRQSREKKNARAAESRATAHGRASDEDADIEAPVASRVQKDSSYEKAHESRPQARSKRRRTAASRHEERNISSEPSRKPGKKRAASASAPKQRKTGLRPGVHSSGVRNELRSRRYHHDGHSVSRRDGCR